MSPNDPLAKRSPRPGARRSRRIDVGRLRGEHVAALEANALREGARDAAYFKDLAAPFDGHVLHDPEGWRASGS